jgi:hypothetical protein
MVEAARVKLTSLWFLLLLGAGCGARSSLETSSSADGDGSGGAGASIPNGAGGSGASDGGGGSEPIVCGELAVDGPAITLSLDGEPAEFSERDPKLVGVDGDRVMSFTTRTFIGAEGAELHATTFDAWDSWPTTQGPANRVAGAVRRGTAVGAGLAGDASALLPLFSLGTPGAVMPAFAPSVAPAQAYDEVPYSFQFLLGSLPQVPQLVLARSASEVRLATTVDSDGDWLLARMVTDIDGNPMTDFDGASGCGDRPTIARAVATSAGVLTAMTSGQGYGGCLDGDGPAGPPTRVQVELAGPGGQSLAFERIAPEPYAEIGLVATIGGAWLLMRTDGSTSVTPPAVIAQLLGADGEAAGEYVAVGDGETAGPLAVVPLGEGFALAYAAGLNAESPAIVVAMFDADAALISQTSIDPQTNAIDSISLVASPSQRELVVAWAGSEEGALARAARVACD